VRRASSIPKLDYWLIQSPWNRASTSLETRFHYASLKLQLVATAIVSAFAYRQTAIEGTLMARSNGGGGVTSSLCLDFRRVTPSSRISRAATGMVKAGMDGRNFGDDHMNRVGSNVYCYTSHDPETGAQDLIRNQVRWYRASDMALLTPTKTTGHKQDIKQGYFRYLSSWGPSVAPCF
jgi:hypothetical protein